MTATIVTKWIILAIDHGNETTETIKVLKIIEALRRICCFLHFLPSNLPLPSSSRNCLIPLYLSLVVPFPKKVEKIDQKCFDTDNFFNDFFFSTCYGLFDQKEKKENKTKDIYNKTNKNRLYFFLFFFSESTFHKLYI